MNSKNRDRLDAINNVLPVVGMALIVVASLALAIGALLCVLLLILFSLGVVSG